MSVYALLDCNNFYASCERLFNPSLNNQPIIVLSNNDGCVIARSNEAKLLGVPMGVPYFQVKNIVTQHNIKVFSSNYALYGDISRRVMSIIASMLGKIEIYSIDEAFIDLSNYQNPEKMAHYIQQIVTRWTGIPVSIGIGKSKTLAKLANKIAKDYKVYRGVFYIDSDVKRIKILKAMDVSEIWGIGSKLSKKLHSYNIRRAFDLIACQDLQIRKLLGVKGLQIAGELRGYPCLDLIHKAPLKKMITVSRSFGRRVFEKENVQEALANFVQRAGIKLREEKLLAKEAYISLYREFSASGVPNYKDTAFISFAYPTDSTLEIMRAAMRVFSDIYQVNQGYKKCGITLYNMQPKQFFVKDLFDQRDIAKHDRLMQVIDAVNSKMGMNSLQIASAQGKGKWIAKKDHKSNNYTTNWNELLRVA